MAVFNVHERLLAAKASEVGALIDTLAAGPADRLWPGTAWPEMRLDRGLTVGAAGGHGPVGYTITAYVPGTWIRFTFTRPRGFHGFHEFAVLPVDEGRTVLRHTLAMRATGPALLTWPLAYRPLHDALLEDSLDRAELACTGTLAHRARWTPYVRLLHALRR
ncbi:SRPBCC family protein [Streptomyces sp. NBC_01351]|uniref:SRPBCC family protein n=1 Tax=Streptomyces sp. NBC_01351 TaxID=2903833 RepID=UPI002E30AC91|nr:SRPBCC family protein [Streptomyces sp. NBC_01351]